LIGHVERCGNEVIERRRVCIYINPKADGEGQNDLGLVDAFKAQMVGRIGKST